MGRVSRYCQPWRVFREARCRGGLRGLLVVVGLLLAWPASRPAAERVAKKLMRPRTRSTSAARQAARDTAMGLHGLCLG